MPSVPDPLHVKPWYLRNITEALALEESSGNVYVRTGFTGNIIIAGNVNIPGTVTVNSSAEDPVHIHLDEVGTSGILDVPYLPVSVVGNIANITGNVRVTQGTIPWSVSGNVDANITGGNVSITGNIAGITSLPSIQANITGGNVSITGNIAGITSLPSIQANITGGNINANVTQGTIPWSVSGNVNANVTGGNVSITGNIAGITSLPSIQANITGGNVSITGNIAGITSLPSIQANITGGNVSITGNIAGITSLPSIQANITGGNINANVTQGTIPWSVSGNVNATLNNNANVIISGFSGATADAFGRLRVSEPYTLFDTNNRYYNHNQFSTASSGTANVVYVENQSSFQLNVGSDNGDSVIRETLKVFPYQPGKSQLTLLTLCMNTPKSNLRQRVGLFGASDGVFFENDGQYNYMVIRSGSTEVEERVRQDAWNGDRLNGAGGANNPSGITLYPDRAQIYYADVEWLGVGSVRVGFVINGQYILCHTFQHANQTGNTKVYMTTATLPIRYEITNTGATAGASMMTQICSTVISEGGYNSFGTTQSAGTGTTQKRLSNSGTYYPVVSIRLNSSRLDSIVFPRQIDVLSPSVNYYRWALVQNPTLTGATWATTSPTGTVDIDIAATEVSGGIEIQSGYAASRELAQLSAVDYFQFQLGRTLAGVSDVVSLIIAATANNADVLAELGWQELT